MGCSMAQHQGTRCHLSSKLASILRKHNTMPYDTHGGGHIGELRLYCPRTEVKFSEMTSGAQRHVSSRKIVLARERRAQEVGARQGRGPLSKNSPSRGAGKGP